MTERAGSGQDTRGLEAALGLLALFVLLSAALRYLLQERGPNLALWLAVSLLPPLLLAAAALVLARRCGLPLGPPACATWSLGGLLLLGAGCSSLVAPTAPLALAPLLAPPGAYVYAFLWVGAAAPLIEELYFRGVLQPLLGRHYPGVLPVLVPAVLFMLAHAGLPGLWLWLALGLAFGLVALAARSVWPAAAAHAGWNLGTLLLGSFPGLPPLAAGLGAVALGLLLTGCSRLSGRSVT